MTEFLKHENEGAPPFLSDMREVRHNTKSDLIQCLVRLAPAVEEDTAEIRVNAKTFDGSVIVNMLPPKLCSTFVDYSEKVFLPCVIR